MYLPAPSGSHASVAVNEPSVRFSAVHVWPAGNAPFSPQPHNTRYSLGVGLDVTAVVRHVPRARERGRDRELRHPAVGQRRGSMPFSGHGGAGGCSGPSGANMCCCQIARWALTSFFSVSMRIGLAEAATAPQPRMAATIAVAATPRSKLLFICMTLYSAPARASGWIGRGVSQAPRPRLYPAAPKIIRAAVALVSARCQARAPRCAPPPRAASCAWCRARRRPRAGCERRVLAGAVALVADRLLGQHRRRVEPSSAARRRARSSGSAVRNTLTSASGATTVPMSRPSATQSPSPSSRRCCSTTGRAHGGLGRRPRRRLGHLRRADLLGHVAPVDQDPLAELDPQRRRDRRRLGAALSAASATRGTSHPMSR